MSRALALAPAPALPVEPVALAHQVIGYHGKSFALASKLLPAEVCDEAVVLYAWCRRVDDAVDTVSAAEQPHALQQLRAELDEVYGRHVPRDPLLAALQQLVRARRIPRHYPEELLAGMAMDVEVSRYDTLDELLGYSYRVASVVGLMMCHVMGVKRPEALAHAAHLGLAMQLTNIARDVAEDWARGRLYLPDELLARYGAGGLQPQLDNPLPVYAITGVAGAVAELLALADGYYRSGAAGLSQLSPRCALAVDAARLIYADIGRAVRAQGCDPRAGRAFVSAPRKLWLVARAGLRALARLPRAWRSPRIASPRHVLPLQAALALPGGRP